MPTAKQDRDFLEEMIGGNDLLDRAIQWVVANLQPDEVFSEKTLEEWATDNGYSKQ